MQAFQPSEEQIQAFTELVKIRMAKFRALPQNIQDSFNAAAASKTPEIEQAQKIKSRQQFHEADLDGDNLLNEEECYNYHQLTQNHAKSIHGDAYFLNREETNKIYAFYNTLTPGVEGFSEQDLDKLGPIYREAMINFKKQ